MAASLAQIDAALARARGETATLPAPMGITAARRALRPPANPGTATRLPCGLTPRQRDVLLFIATQIEAGRSPTLRAIGAAFGIRSTNGVTDHLVALERWGYLEADGTARGLRLTTEGWAVARQHGVGLRMHLAARIAELTAEERAEVEALVSALFARRGGS
jgi:DNA-binding MarR family transcriptional regulator